MMNLEKIKHVHFIGIGGIGMSALARYFNRIGKSISGYDKTRTDLTMELESEGMTVYYTESVQNIPDNIQSNPRTEDILVVYTPAIPKEHVELQFFEQKQKTLYKRSEILGFISQMYPTIGVAGTHGKTTTTSILAFILLEANADFVGFVGGINENFKSNLVMNGAANLMLTEADEYDRSFLKLSPSRAIITSMDPDHLDIYHSEEALKSAFIEYAERIENPADVLIHQSLASNFSNQEHSTYGLTEKSMYRAEKVVFSNGKFHFNFKGPEVSINDIELALPGYHNLENTVAAIALCVQLGIDHESIKRSLSKYKGVKRRFEYHVVKDNFIYIDDYAHHPKELDAVIGSVKKMYPSKSITGVFQPHLFSRTKDFADAFAQSLSNLDRLFLLDIYPAREKPIEGIDSKWLLSKVELIDKHLTTSEELVKDLKTSKPEILLTLGAGDIDQLIKPIKTAFS